jgi:molybdate/tungstate transport system permease protein
MTTPVMVYQRYNDFGLESARPVAVLLILICISIFLSVRLFSLRLKPMELADA